MRIIALAVLLAAFAGTFASAQETSRAGRIFEDSLGGRYAAMGGSGVAAARDASAIYYNPAGLALLPSREFQFQRVSLFEGASLNALSYAQNLSKKPGGFGVQILNLGVSGGQGRDAVNAPSSGLNYSEMAITGAGGVRGALWPELSLGSAVKMLSRKLGGSSDRLIGVDIGAQYGPVNDGTVIIGAVLRNALSLSQGDTSDKLPIGARVGASWKPLPRLLVAAEAGQSADIHFGAEWSFGAAALRAGYGGGGPTFGAGITFRESFYLDLTLANSSAGLSQRIGLGYRFGRGKPKKLNSFADGYLAEGQALLARREYEEAARVLETAVGIRADVGDGQWKRRVTRLQTIVTGAEISGQEQDRAELRSESAAALLASRAMGAFVDGRQDEASVLFHVAAGTAGRDSVYMRLLQSEARATRQTVTREDIVGPAVFVQDRMRKSYEAVYARRYEASVRACREALFVEPNDAVVWMRLGSTHFAAGDKAKALEAYNKSLEIDPNNSKLRGFISEKYQR